MIKKKVADKKLDKSLLKKRHLFSYVTSFFTLTVLRLYTQIKGQFMLNLSILVMKLLHVQLQHYFIKMDFPNIWRRIAKELVNDK